MAFISSPGSTNEVDTASIQVSTVSTPVSTVSSHDNTTNLSDATVYAFLANQPNRSLLMGVILLVMTRQRYNVSIFIRWDILQGNAEVLGTKKAGQGIKTAQERLNVEDTSYKAMVAINGAGFGWSYMADDEVPTNMALMDFSDSEVQDNKTSSKTCLKSFKTLKTQYDNLRIEFNKSEFDLATYKRGLASVKEQLVFYKKNEVVFCDQLLSLKEMPHLETRLFAPPTIDLSNSGLEEFQHHGFKGYGHKDSKTVSVDTLNDIKKAYDAPIIEDWDSDSDEDESENMVLKSDNVQHKPEKANQPRKEFCSKNSFNKSDIVSISTARHNSSRAAAPVSAARPINTDASKPLVNVENPRQSALQKSHSLSRRPFYQQTALKNRNLNNNVNTAKANSVNTAKGNKVATVGAPQDALKDQGYFDSRCSRHMIGNISYLTDFKEHDEGYVAFRGGAKCGKITGKGTIRTGKLDFKDVYFVRELQFNLFSVSQMCDKKNSVLYTDTECFVLSPNFKLANESQVLLKVPRKNNMYSFDMKNIVPQKDLTCLLAKVTNDESMLWHRRLGRINFKNINKLVKDDLVRGLSLKLFKNDQTCVACLKGKQHKVSFKSKL
uniref:Ribonuclease H-like domain-containing protein n=1 Tax=Tanacetum cinerariifolium TaxID=118510 RepID=A0A6L2JAP3_TANCI|nr:ribonuclease H-like domain-containing protein [Tanacetum cinerariifolium]